MGTLVTYRDLPGGPMKIKFADEISRHCLCRQCHMLSLCMYSDSASHMFCDDCLNDQSYKHQKYEIYCPDEGKDVSLAQMFQARDLVTILCDQYVECPNQPKCTVKLPLGQLEKHYIECKEMSSIKCTKCGHKVPSTSWMQHKTDCQPTCDNELPRKKSDHRDGKRKPPPASSASLPVSASRENGSAKNTTAAPSALYPSSLLPDATTGEFDQQFQSLGSASTSTQPPVKSQGPASIEPEKTTCKHCGKNIKESNMPRHLEVCYEVRTACAYCDKDVARKDIKAHTEECKRKFEETREASDAAAAASGNSKKSKKTKVAPPEPHENTPHQRNNSNTKRMIFQAHDLVTILADQYVECPNKPKCTVKLPLGQLEKHYIECKEMSSIKCTKCGHKVPSTSWMEHKTDCQPKCDNDFPRKSQGPASIEPEKTTCKHCGKNIKESNMPRHLEVCYEVRTTCAYCNKDIFRKDIKAHTEECMRKFEETREASDAAAAASGNSKKSKKTKVAPPEPHENPPHQRNNSNTKRMSQGPASIEPEKTTCKHCGRNMKESNMPRHLEVCYEVRTTCAYCDKDVARKDIEAHTEECKRKFEETREASDAAAAASGNSKKSKKTKVAPPEPHENPPHQRNNSNTKRMSQGPASVEPEKTTCKHCGWNVKESNMPRHLEVCYEVRTTCAYCNKDVARKDMKAHTEECMRKFEETREASDAAAAASGNSKKPQFSASDCKRTEGKRTNCRRRHHPLHPVMDLQCSGSALSNPSPLECVPRLVLANQSKKTQVAPPEPHENPPHQRNNSNTKRMKHYIECKEMSSTKCTKCGHKVPSTSWMEHKTDCQPKCDNDFPRKSQGPASIEPEKTTCKHCGRNVKESIMPRHLEVCYEVRTTCAYCDKDVARKDIKAHTEECKRKFEETREASDAAAAASGNSKKSKKTKVAPPEPHENPPHQRNDSNTKRMAIFAFLLLLCPCTAYSEYDPSQPLVLSSKATIYQQTGNYLHIDPLQLLRPAICAPSSSTVSSHRSGNLSGCPSVSPFSWHRSSIWSTMAHTTHLSTSQSKTSMTLEAKGTSAKRASRTEQELQLWSGWSTDVSAWFPYATAGNWYAAYVAVEEQFKDTGTDQAARHAHFVPKLVALKHDRFVRDFIDAPYGPQPFGCLITALIVRACLPLNVWPKGFKKVTWEDVLRYLPTVLYSRLSVGAKLYLQKHPVIFEDNGYHNVDEVGTVAANALIPGHTPSVTSSDPVTTETQALDVPEVDMRDATGAQKQEPEAPQALGKEEDAQHSKKSRKYGLVASEQESNTTFHNTSPSDHLGPSADESMNYLAATKARSHSNAGTEHSRMTCAEVVKKSYPKPTATAAFNHDRDDGQESCHRKSGSYEVNETSPCQTRSSICEGKPAYSAVSEDRKLNPSNVTGHMPGGVPSSHQPNKGFSFESTEEDSKPKYVAGSPQPGSLSEEVAPTLLSLQHEQSEIIQADSLGSANTKYEVSRGISSQNSRIGHFREKDGCVKTLDQTQQELSEGTNERQCDETERSISGLDSDLVSTEQKSYTAFQNATPSYHSAPSADEPMKYLAATKARSHSTAGTEPCRMTCAEAFKESNPTPTTTGAFIHDRDDGQESCHRKSGSYEINETCPCKTRSSIFQGKPAYSAVSEDRKINPSSVTRHMPGGVPSSHQLNKGFYFETAEEDSKPKYVAGSPQPGSLSEEVPPTLLSLQHEQSEIIQVDALGSANTKYEVSRGMSSQNSRIRHFREKGGCVKTHDQTQQELSEGTNERQCDETERSISGLDSDLVSSEQESYTAFQNAAPSHHSGPSAGEPMKYLAATKPRSHSAAGTEPCRMTYAEVVTKSYPTPTATAAFIHDRDDGPESCPRKCESYEVSESYAYKIGGINICEDKPAHSVVSEDKKISSNAFAVDIGRGALSCRQPNKGFSTETTDEDSKPKCVTGSPLPGSSSGEVPPTPLNLQHQDNEIRQADALRSSTTKYERSRRRSSQNARIVWNSGVTQKHDNVGVRKERRAGLTNTETRCTSSKAVASLSHPEPTEKSPVGTFYTANVNLEMRSTEKHRRANFPKRVDFYSCISCKGSWEENDEHLKPKASKHCYESGSNNEKPSQGSRNRCQNSEISQACNEDPAKVEKSACSETDTTATVQDFTHQKKWR
ncbi:uncharacterized protein [Dermacentor andersoni]|uniref:uncharacterized protein isoform X3 n=1 Tax=Dermacentor andersoni TaxID=34620 RepID=UPI0024179785|nr:uncharacterized protein LOC126544574 isoform X3 [Dermacentor andersoni]